MAMKKCKDCGTEISQSAKVCPKCGKDQRNFLQKHKILSFFLAILIVGVLCAAINGTESTPTSSDSSSKTTSTSIVTKENYDKIQKGMTKAEVKNILGEPASISENESPGIGTMELNHYQEAFSLKGIDVYYLDGKVYMKNWTEL